MKFDKRADLRTIWVFAVLGALILVITLSGVWKRIDFFITLASFLGFDSGEPPAGTSIIGVNMEKGDLRYFTGEKWVKIDEKASSYLLGDYEFNPKDVKNSFYNFYVKTPRKPSTISFEANHWRYLEASFISTDWGKVRVSSNTKNGFAGPMGADLGNLGYSNSLDYEGISYISQEGSIHPDFLKYDLSRDSLWKVVSWRDSILEGASCEKFMPLKIAYNLPVQAQPSQVESKYSVRKIDEYLFVDLAKPVFAGVNEKYSKDNCFQSISYVDVDRSNWKNGASLQINFVENDAFLGKGTPSKIWWLSFGQPPSFAWSYQSSKTDWNQVLLIDKTKVATASDPSHKVPYKYWLDDHSSFYNGLIELVSLKNSKNPGAFNNGEEAYDVHVFVKSGSVEREVELSSVLATNTAPLVDTPRGLNNDPQVVSAFLYRVLDEYNKHLFAPPEPSVVLPEYLFLLRDNSLNLVNKFGISQDVQISGGKIIAGPLNLGVVGSTGLISIDYASSGISVGQSPAVDFINGKNLFDLTYGLDATSPVGFSKFSKDFIPPSFLGVSS